MAPFFGMNDTCASGDRLPLIHHLPLGGREIGVAGAAGTSDEEKRQNERAFQLAIMEDSRRRGIKDVTSRSGAHGLKGFAAPVRADHGPEPAEQSG